MIVIKTLKSSKYIEMYLLNYFEINLSYYEVKFQSIIIIISQQKERSRSAQLMTC